MKRWMRALSAALALGATAFVARADSEPARAADAFVDFIGVNTHLGYSDTVYREFETVIRPRLLELGVRHIRDGTFSDEVARRYLELASHGLRVLLITEARRASRQAERILPALWGLEGVNEPDLRPGGWVEWTRREQMDLYDRVKTNAALAQLPVLVSSLANIRDHPAQLGSLEPFLDCGNLHPYAAGQSPSRHWGWGTSQEQAIREARKVSGAKPIVVTECGYHNRLAEEGHPGCSERAAGRYLPRLLFVYFNAGIHRAYLYEFADEKPDPEFKDKEQHFGLVRRDGSIKPAFSAIKRLIQLLADPGPSFPTGKMDFTLEGASPQVHRTLLQKRDGRFYLALWLEADSWDTRARRDLEPTPEEVLIRWQTPPREVTVFRPSTSAEAIQRVAGTNGLRLQVPDEVVILEVLP